MTKQQWTVKQLKYIQIQADPTEARSQEKIAKSLGVTRKTLYEWRDKAGYWAAVKKLYEDHTKQHLPKVWNSVARRALRGDMVAAKMILTIHDGYAEKSEVKTEVVPPAVSVNFKS